MTDWGRQRNIFRGIIRLAQFNSQGLLEFGDTPQAFINSLAPLLAFPLVGGARTLLAGSPHLAVANVLVSAIALITPPVISHLFASLWHRESLWLRYATAYNWCQVAIFVPLLVLWLVTAGRLGRAGPLWVLLPFLYVAVLNGFLAQRALRVSVLRALLLVVGVTLGFYFLMVVPVAIIAWLRGVNIVQLLETGM
jgi:hypothetical protein